MDIRCTIVKLPQLKVRNSDGATNMVLAQPGFTPYRSEERGYGLAHEDRDKARLFVEDCLAVVRAEATPHTLLVFPEACVPVVSVQTIREFAASDCPNNTVIVAGLESMSAREATECDELPMTATLRDRLRDSLSRPHAFINTSLIVVRDDEGQVHAHLQPKLSPSHAEQTLPHMVTGDQVLVFTCRQLAFLVLVCSDLMQKAPSGEWLVVRVIDAIKTAWDETQPSTSLTVDLFINIQCNPEPNHRSFREAAKSVLYRRTDSVRLDTASILIANWGGLWDRAEPMLGSGIIYQQPFWRTPRADETNVPVGYSFTPDTLVEKLNIVAFRSSKHGRVRFQMPPCSQADMTDPSRRYPLRECYFEHCGERVVERIEQNAWRDRCERWLARTVAESTNAAFWDAPNNDEMQSELHAKYQETRRQILGKTDTDLRDNCLCLVLSRPSKNPDLWGPQQRTALNKWAAIATMFHYDDQSTDFTGGEWFSFRWHRDFFVAVIDGEESLTCELGLSSYYDSFGERLPRDPSAQTVVIVVLYRHTTDSRSDVRRVSPFQHRGWHEPKVAVAGVRAEPTARRPDDLVEPRARVPFFWCTASDFDKALTATSKESFCRAMETICVP